MVAPRAPALRLVRWTPAFHAKLVERPAAISRMALPARRAELREFLKRGSAEARVHDQFVPSFDTPPFRVTRFSDGSFPAFYVAKDPDVALSEKLYHDRRYFLGLAPVRVPGPHALELMTLGVTARVVDLRGARGATDPTSYARTHRMATAARMRGADGVLYSSVRAGGGDCLALFTATVLQAPAIHRAVVVEWDGLEFLWP